MTLATLPLLRILRSRHAWVLVLGSTVLALGSAWLQRRHGAAHGADQALLNVYSSVAVPLLAYGVVSATLEGCGLARSGGALRRFGADPVRVAVTTVLAGVVVSAVLCGLIGAVVAVWAHGAGDPPPFRDALETLVIGAMGGAAYAAVLGLGGAMGAGSWVRWLLLILDWTLGDGVDLAATLLPRAHLRNALGGTAPLDLAPRESLLALAFLTLLYVTSATKLATWRRRR